MTLPIKMLYRSSNKDKGIVVEVYNFTFLESTYDTVATFWHPESDCWATVPIYTLTPIKHQVKPTKKYLNETI